MADRWEWRRPKGHETQSLDLWYVEQVAVFIVVWVAKRAHRRGDKRTTQRMLAISRAGADAEES